MRRAVLATPVVLGMIEAGHRTGYSIAQAVARSTAHFWPAGQNAIYPELKRLVDDGLLTMSTDNSDGRHKEQHVLTPRGVAALDGWRHGDSALRIDQRDEGLLKLHFGDALTAQQASELLETLIEQRRDRLKRLQDARPAAHDRAAAHVSWHTGQAQVQHAIDWYGMLLGLLAGRDPAARAMPILADALD